MSWDPFQREILSALGHDLYAVPDTATGSVPDAREALAVALLRAAARTVDAADADALCKAWGPLERLRTAAAKRALWPRLRTLRARA